jgi:hypothetical protein
MVAAGEWREGVVWSADQAFDIPGCNRARQSVAVAHVWVQPQGFTTQSDVVTFSSPFINR